MDGFSRRDVGRSPQPGRRGERSENNNVTRWQAEEYQPKKHRSLGKRALDRLGGKKKHQEQQNSRLEATTSRYKMERREEETRNQLKSLDAEVGRYVSARFEVQNRLGWGKTLEQISGEFGEDKVVWMKGFEQRMEYDRDLSSMVQNKLEERRAGTQRYNEAGYNSLLSDWYDGIGREPQPPAPVEFPEQFDLPMLPPAYSPSSLE